MIRDKFSNYYSNFINCYDDYHKSKPGAERGVFCQLYKDYGYLPITVDSHLGEYLQWGHSVAIQSGTLKKWCANLESLLVWALMPLE